MKDINRLYEEWKNLQPLTPENRRRLDTKFMLEFNYNSNHLEGNTLTYGQTELLLMFGETSGNATLKDYEEMKAHNVGLEMIKQEAADKERPLSETFIRQLNKTILVENYWKNATTPTGQPTRVEIKAGEYKTRPNSVITATGETFEYATPEETPALMKDLVAWYNQEEAKGELSPLELATLLHYRYIRIHPFEDGNGRIARLLVNYVLLRHNCPMVVIRSKDKENYLRVLHQCDIAVGLHPSDGAYAELERIEPSVEYMEEQMKRAFEICIKAAKGESIEEEDDFEKRIELLAREAQAKRKGVMHKSDEAINWLIEEVFLKMCDKIKHKLSKLDKFYNEIEYSCFLSNDVTNKYIIFTKEDLPLQNTLDYYKLSLALHADKPTTLLKSTSKLHHTLDIILHDDNYGLSITEDNSKLDWINFFSTTYTYLYGKTASGDRVNAFINHFIEKVYKDLEKEIAKL